MKTVAILMRALSISLGFDLFQVLMSATLQAVICGWWLLLVVVIGGWWLLLVVLCVVVMCGGHWWFYYCFCVMEKD